MNIDNNNMVKCNVVPVEDMVQVYVPLTFNNPTGVMSEISDASWTLVFAECEKLSSNTARVELLNTGTSTVNEKEAVNCEIIPATYDHCEVVPAGTQPNVSIGKHYEYECECGYFSNELYRYLNHRRTHLNVKLFQCDQCEFSCNRRSDLNKHKMVHPTVNRKCDRCNFSSVTLKEFIKHRETHLQAELFRCAECEFSSTNRRSFETHQMTHSGEKPFKCEQCDFASFYRYQYEVHLSTHPGGKLFQCEKCVFSCTSQERMKVHKSTHHPNSKFQCEHCSYSSNFKSHMKKHKATHKEKLCKCDECGYFFNYEEALMKHKLIHSGGKPFQCDKCEFFARNLGDLKKHQAVAHSVVKLYKCDQCEASFALENGLKEHVVLHSDEKPFKCDQCGLSFSLKNQMKKHCDTHKAAKTPRATKKKAPPTHTNISFNAELEKAKTDEGEIFYQGNFPTTSSVGVQSDITHVHDNDQDRGEDLLYNVVKKAKIEPFYELVATNL